MATWVLPLTAIKVEATPADVLVCEGGGSGQMIIDLRSPVSAAGSNSSEFRQELRIAEAGGEVPLEQTVSTDMSFGVE